MKPRLAREHMTAVYERLERPLIYVLEKMERTGIKVDAQKLRDFSADFEKRMAELETHAHKLAGHEFNVGSPKQVGEILFDEMSLDGGKKGKTGAYSTSADVLEDLVIQGHELPQTILDWRQLQKLKSTYTDALVETINPDTGRVHTSFSQAVTSTGRLSSNDPNLQNIPIRSDEGRKIRQAFVADKGHILMSADYSQIELRLLAHVADIESLKKAFADGQDIHAITASEIFDVPIEGMDPMVRRQAKAINFGIIYGISGFGLARQLSIPRGEAQRYIDAYFERYPGIKDYMERTKKQAHDQGYVETPFGRKCHVRGINEKNQAVRGNAERAAINAPIQGGAADIIKRAMVRVQKALDEIEGALHLTSLENIKEQLESDLVDLSAHGIVLVHELLVAGGDGFVDKLLLLERQIGTDLDVLQSTELAQSTAGKRKSEAERRRDRPTDGVGMLVASLERNAHKLAVHASDRPEGVIVRFAQPDSVEHRRPLPATAAGVDAGLRGQHGQHSVTVHYHEGVIVAESRPRHGRTGADS